MRVQVGPNRWLLLAVPLLCGVLPANTAHAQSNLNPGFAAAEKGMPAGVRAGREIWFFATAFNDRFYTYSYPQRLAARSIGIASSPPRTSGPVSGVGNDTRSGLLRAGRCQLPGQIPRGNIRLPVVVPVTTELLKYRRQDRLSRSGLRLQGLRFRHDHAAWQNRSASKRMRPAFRDLDRCTRAAQVSKSALRS